MLCCGISQIALSTVISMSPFLHVMCIMSIRCNIKDTSMGAFTSLHTYGVICSSAADSTPAQHCSRLSSSDTPSVAAELSQCRT